VSARQARRPSRAPAVALAGLGLAALAYGGLAAASWARYGRAPRRGRARGDGLLDELMPDPEVVERHETEVAAPAAVAWAAARDLDLQRSPLARTIFGIRALPARLLHGTPPAGSGRSLVDETLALGWRPVVELPGRLLVMGAVTRPWEAAVVFRGLPPSEFATFDEPGWAQILWTLEAEPLGPARSRFRTETRVRTTDAEARARFRRYWAAVSPGVRLIRRASLGLVKGDAERRFRAGRPVVDARARVVGP
jgi:hypothetical protein